jgi:hypothetical protein
MTPREVVRLTLDNDDSVSIDLDPAGQDLARGEFEKNGVREGRRQVEAQDLEGRRPRRLPRPYRRTCEGDAAEARGAPAGETQS